MAISTGQNKLLTGNEIQDDELVRQFQSGYVQAFDLLVERYQARTLSLCFRFLQEPEDARDIAQEVFIKVYHHLGAFKPEAQFSTWLYRITVNACLNALRSRRRRRWLLPFSAPDARFTANIMNVADGNGNPELTLEKSEQSQALQKALDALPEDQRTAIILHRYQGLSYKEIATVLQASVASVESRIHRGRKKLGVLLAKYL